MNKQEKIKEALDGFHKLGRTARMKADFQEGIERDYAHIEGLEALLSARFAYFENENWAQYNPFYTQLRHAELQVEINDLQERILLQKKALSDKMKHYEEVFSPMYEQRLENVRQTWDNLLSACQDYVDSQYTIWLTEPIDAKRLERMTFYLKEYESLEDEEKKDIEIRANYHTIFSNLLPKQ
jgi:hypothetical protein